MAASLPDSARVDPGAVAVAKRLIGAGHEAYLVGGCVRDLLLGLAPRDYDVATSARPEEVRALFDRTVPVGERFGVIMVLWRGRPFEVATFRTEGGYSDHRRPDEVDYACARADVERRDFTINGLFYDVDAGKVVDHVGGAADLAAGLLRTIGAPLLRFEEDHLRLLRAVRFACRFALRIEDATFAGLRARAGGIADVAGERVRDELLGIVGGPDPARGLRLLEDSGLLAVVLPEVAATRGVAQPAAFHPEGDVFVHTGLVLAALREPSPVLAMGALLHDIGKPPTYEEAPDRIRFNGHDAEGARMADRVCRRLRFSNEEREAIVGLVAGHMRFQDVPRMREATLKRFLRAEDFADHLELHRADCLGSHGSLDYYDYCLRRLDEFRARDAAEALRPAPLLRGGDLITEGYLPGPLFAEILAAVEDEQLEGRLIGRGEALRWVKDRWPLGG